MTKTSPSLLKEIYTQRPSEVKKYDYGLLFVIGGSDFYSGAPALSALAGFQAGVDMVRVIAPKRAADIIASFSPTLASYPLPSSHLQQQDLATLVQMVSSGKEVSYGKTAVVIGGGAGRSEETLQTILAFLSQTDVPVVIDADAIHAVAKDPNVLAGKPFLVTPNTFEFALLTGKEVRQLPHEQRIALVQEEAKRLNTTILLKVKTDIISDGKEVYLNETGSPYMSKGGMGDTLAGIAGALLARNGSALKAGAAAAFINGKAGETAAAKYKESLTTLELIDTIKTVIQ